MSTMKSTTLLQPQLDTSSKQDAFMPVIFSSINYLKIMTLKLVHRCWLHVYCKNLTFKDYFALYHNRTYLFTCQSESLFFCRSGLCFSFSHNATLTPLTLWKRTTHVLSLLWREAIQQVESRRQVEQEKNCALVLVLVWVKLDCYWKRL